MAATRSASRARTPRRPPRSPRSTCSRASSIAVDTKDRYTKRHSEDVARYGVFLAQRVAAPAELVATIRTAGLLHDVGKIGIPDAILRKPGKLTDAEYEVVKQHVALGDAIVRDLPDVELIRAGIRHHHERWDGDGYLDRLAGEDIPLIARILAVGDAFSAMTTTRPYRKALDVREALHRLEDAAGSQLDAALVSAFVDGHRDGRGRAAARVVVGSRPVDAARRVTVRATRARAAAPILAVLLVCLLPGVTLAARLWTFTGSPLVASVGVPVTVTSEREEHRRQRRRRRDDLRPGRCPVVVRGLGGCDRLGQGPDVGRGPSMAGVDRSDQRRGPGDVQEPHRRQPARRPPGGRRSRLHDHRHGVRRRDC